MKKASSIQDSHRNCGTQAGVSSPTHGRARIMTKRRRKAEKSEYNKKQNGYER